MLSVAQLEVLSELRHAGDADPRIHCQLKAVPGRAPNWDCEGPGESSFGSSSFSYSVENGRDKWFVHVEGPSGPWDFEREPKDTDPGEAWPTSCPCSPYAIYISQEDFEKVGVSWE